MMMLPLTRLRSEIEHSDSNVSVTLSELKKINISMQMQLIANVRNPFIVEHKDSWVDKVSIRVNRKTSY